MKAIAYRNIQVVNQNGNTVYVPSGSEVHFDIDPTGLYQEMQYNGEVCWLEGSWPVMAIEPETIADISVALDIQKEMENRKKVLIISIFNTEVQTCCYVYPGEELHTVMWNVQRRLFPQIVEMLSPDASVSCYIVVQDRLDNSLYKFFRKEKDRVTQLCELESMDEVLDHFNRI